MRKILVTTASALLVFVTLTLAQPVAKKYYATCVSGGPGRAHLDRTWNGPKRDKSADAQKDANEHDKADSNKKCQAWVASVDE